MTGGPVVGTFGFLRSHKGVVELIRAVRRLRRTYPQIRLLAVTALYPSDDSAACHRLCLDEIERGGLRGHATLLTDFLEPRASIEALQACDVVVLPYAVTIDSSSAAVRVALASGRPVVTSTAPVFDEVGDAVVRVGSRRPRPLARAISRALDDENLRPMLDERSRRLREEDAWTVVGRTYRRILRSAVTDLTAFRSPYPFDAASS